MQSQINYFLGQDRDGRGADCCTHILYRITRTTQKLPSQQTCTTLTFLVIHYTTESTESHRQNAGTSRARTHRFHSLTHEHEPTLTHSELSIILNPDPTQHTRRSRWITPGHAWAPSRDSKPVRKDSPLLL